jgi:inorganic pyrophosphatase
LEVAPVKTLFWEHLDSLLQSAQIVIDRPRGSTHPRYPSYIYPLDYGYLEGTSGGDGQEIDVWRGSLPEDRLDAIVCTVDLLKKDAEVKLLLGCTDQEMTIVSEFHNNGRDMAAMLVRREGR